MGNSELAACQIRSPLGRGVLLTFSDPTAELASFSPTRRSLCMSSAAAAANRVDESIVAAAQATGVVSTSTPDSSRRRRQIRWLRPNILLGKLITAALVFLVYHGFNLVMFDTARYISVVRGRPLLALAYRAHFVFCLTYLITSFGLVYFGNRSSKQNQPPSAVIERTAVRAETG